MEAEVTERITFVASKEIADFIKREGKKMGGNASVFLRSLVIERMEKVKADA